ncbi:MAG: hypothetical protein IJ371_02595 [Clostridia bacterium]|nr:hypothetical protein [Clostridia bacterium]
MKKFEYNGEIYYLIKGKFVDENFLEVPTGMQTQVENAFYNNVDYKTINEDALLDLIREIKKSEKYDLCIIMCEYGLDKFKTKHEFIKNLLSTYTSCLRLSKQYKQAILLGESYLGYEIYHSAPLFISMAAAYCDEYEYGMGHESLLDVAQNYNDRAKGMKGKGKEDSLEIRRLETRLQRLKPFDN